MWPEREREVNNSTCLVSFCCGLLWSCGPQFASHKDVTVDGSIGNLTCDSSFSCCLLLKLIPSVLVPLRYLMTRFAALMCDCVAFTVYWASRFVIVAISGRVDNERHVKHHMSTCI
jgi:hypothetical protein